MTRQQPTTAPQTSTAEHRRATRPRVQVVVPIAATAVLLTLTGCTTTTAHCTAGYAPTFTLTVHSSTEPEPGVRFCDTEQCSPIPEAGPIPSYLADETNDTTAFLRHVGHGRWQISPGGTSTDPPADAVIELYRDGQKIATRHLHLDWPEFDPCRTSNPPAPSPTITAP